jgi:hypothetical protein
VRFYSFFEAIPRDNGRDKPRGVFALFPSKEFVERRACFDGCVEAVEEYACGDVRRD